MGETRDRESNPRSVFRAAVLDPAGATRAPRLLRVLVSLFIRGDRPLPHACGQFRLSGQFSASPGRTKTASTKPIGPRYVTFLAPQIRRQEAGQQPARARGRQALETHGEPGAPRGCRAVRVERMYEECHPVSLALGVGLRKGICGTGRSASGYAAQRPGSSVSKLSSAQSASIMAAGGKWRADVAWRGLAGRRGARQPDFVT